MNYFSLAILSSFVVLGNCQTQELECTMADKRAMTRCADPLYDIGAFKTESQSQSLGWEFFAQKTEVYFKQVCDAFHRFDLCIEPYKRSCFEEEPIKSEYRTATEVLEFICQDGYQDMMTNYQCFVSALSSREMLECQSEMIENTQRVPDQNSFNDDSQKGAVCGVMRNYMKCIKFPIRYECGFRAWEIIREIVQRPTYVVMPDCHLGSSALVPSIITLVFSLLLARLKLA